jgi:hypothetical protein
MISVLSAVEATVALAAVAWNVALAEKADALDIVTVYDPAFSKGTTTSAVISPLRLALGAGLGRAEAEPMFSVVTVPRELKPVPVIVIVSSTAASAGVIVMVGLGVENSVELPTIEPTVADTI